MKNCRFMQMRKILPLMVLLTLCNLVNAQTRYSPKAVTDISISILNLTQPTDRTIEFDVYLLDTDPVQSFELAGVQLGMLFNSLIYTGGTISGRYVNTNSGLLPSQQPSAAVTFNSSMTAYLDKTLLRLASRVVPGAGNGSLISSVSPGTLVTHIILESTVPWAQSSLSNLEFNSNTVPNPLFGTKIAEYISGTNTELTVTPGINAIVCCNPVLNFLTGVDQNSGDYKINIFSANKSIYIDFPGTAKQISVYNMLGSVIAMEENVTGLRKMNMNNFANECYIVKVVTNNGVTTRKVLLK